MLRRSSYLLLALGLAISATNAAGHSCQRTYQGIKPVSFNEDGSFENAGRGAYGYAYGGAVVDVGHSRVAQKITFGHDCTDSSESLVFVNCAADDGIVIHGTRDAEGVVRWGTGNSIRMLQPPHGSIALTASRTTDELEKAAQKADYNYTRDLNSFFRSNEHIKSISYRRLCRVVYPNSLGARG